MSNNNQQLLLFEEPYILHLNKKKIKQSKEKKTSQKEKLIQTEKTEKTEKTENSYLNTMLNGYFSEINKKIEKRTEMKIDENQISSIINKEMNKIIPIINENIKIELRKEREVLNNIPNPSQLSQQNKHNQYKPNNNLQITSSPIEKEDLDIIYNSLKSITRFNNNLQYRSDLISEVLTNPESKFSDLNKNLTFEILSCIKGDSIVPPNRNFIQIDEVKTTPSHDLTENMFKIQKDMKKIHEKYEDEVINNIKHSNKMNNHIYKDLISDVDRIFSECDEKIADTKLIMTSLYKQLNYKFEERVAKTGLANLKIIDCQIEELKKEIIKEEVFFESNKERLNLLSGQTEKCISNANRFLNENGDEEGDKGNDKELSIISEGCIENLYDVYRKYDDYSNGASNGMKKVINKGNSNGISQKSHVKPKKNMMKLKGKGK